MINQRKNNLSTKISVSILFCAFVVAGYFVFYSPNSVIAQSGGSSFITFLIGGETKGISNSGTPLCCNGIKLEFGSVDSNNQYIVDQGEPVLWEPGMSQSYDSGNEFTQGYNTVGLLTPGQCITISSECESTENINVIRIIGTSPGQK
jgi:hypothetical protein